MGIFFLKIPTIITKHKPHFPCHHLNPPPPPFLAVVTADAATNFMKWNQQLSLRPAMAILLEPLINSSNFPHPPSSYATVFQAFTGKNLLKQGQQIHAHLLIRGVRPIAFLAAKMVAMYASSGDIDSAARIFYSIRYPSILLFNSIIRAYSLYKYSEETLQIFVRMHSLSFRGDCFTYPFVLKSTSDLELLHFGKCVHSCSMKDGLEFDLYVGTSIIDMYVKCGELGDARNLFDEMPVKDVSSWNALISGYTKEGSMDLARDLFDEMPTKNIVSWTTMISGYTQNGLAANALQLFDRMSSRDSDVKPNWVTIMSVLPACTHVSALEQGRRIHRFARDEGFDSHPSVQTALIGMYAKCGSLHDAKLYFDRIKPSSRNLVAWNSMITAYATHGQGIEAVQTFESMIQAGIRPDCITFTGLLSGCSHSGLVDVGLRFFASMNSEYGVEKRHEHYGCIVDLLGRAGRLVEAYELITQMPMPAGASVWGALLAAGRCHRNLEIAELAAKKLFVLEPQNSGNYVILSNMYAEASMWEEVKALRALQKSQNVRKNPGCSWIEVDGKAHFFIGGDVSHPQKEKIYWLLKEIPEKMKAAGYVPDTSCSLHDVSEEEKEYALMAHSEKLAVVFGILNTSPGTVLRVTKNLRICGDCHTTMKFVSKMYGREIVVRDVNRFHHFEEGKCSCGDFW